MGITGVNFAAVDTGTIVLVTNEGNGRMCTSLPRVHVAVMPVEKVLPRFADLGVLLPLLTRSATGQRLSTYVSMITGPRRPGEVDGPERLHVIFLDHNRRSLLGTPYQEMLCCVRCGACLNVCPVYRRIGGHAYDAVYSGPMGAVLTPLLSGGTEGATCPTRRRCAAPAPRPARSGSPWPTCWSGCGPTCAGPAPRFRPPPPGRPARRPIRARPAAEPVGVPGDAPGRPADTPPGVRTGRRLAFGAWARLWASPTGYRLSAAATRRLGRLVPDTVIRRAPLVSGWGEGRDIPLRPPVRSASAWPPGRRRVVRAGPGVSGVICRDTAEKERRFTAPRPSVVAFDRPGQRKWNAGSGGPAVTAELVERFAERLAAVGGQGARAVAGGRGARDCWWSCAGNGPARRPWRCPQGTRSSRSSGWRSGWRPAGSTSSRRTTCSGGSGWRRRASGSPGRWPPSPAAGRSGSPAAPGAPRATSLVPPAHICLVFRGTMVEDLAEALGRWTPAADLPSGLVWVSGPSRSADLELVLTVGVHGPGSVDVIVVDENVG